MQLEAAVTLQSLQLPLNRQAQSTLDIEKTTDKSVVEDKSITWGPWLDLNLVSNTETLWKMDGIKKVRECCLLQPVASHFTSPSVHH